MKRGLRAARRRRIAAFLLVVALLAAGGCRGKRRVVLTVSAAASLTEALGEIEAAYLRAHPEVEVRNNFGGSGALAREIELGAPVDVLVSAAARPVDELERKGLLAAGTRVTLAKNTLVLIAPLDAQLKDFGGLAGAGVRRIALGDPKSVPAGQYGEQTLVALGLADRVRSKLVLAKDVRQVEAWVESGDADAGLVYATDVRAGSKAKIVAEAPETAHDAIVYPAAVVAGSREAPAARAFVEFLASWEAAWILRRHGFAAAGH